MTDLCRPSGTLAPAEGLLWVGDSSDAELALARRFAAARVAVFDAVTADAAVAAPPAPFLDRSPAAVLLASPTPDCWRLADVIAISRRWPLAPLISIATSLVDGRRRSGPQLSGVEEVAWNELPGRLAWWLHDRARGRPGGLGMPATARREERVIEVAGRVAEFARWPGKSVSIAASRQIDVEGLADMLAAAGRRIVRRTCGRPALDEPADVLLWDVAAISGAHLTWLGMLAANRPGLAIVVLDSFPRGDSTRAALEAGAVAVLSRPASLESITGILLGLGALVIDELVIEKPGPASP
jgi:hypothetical protein